MTFLGSLSSSFARILLVALVPYGARLDPRAGDDVISAALGAVLFAMLLTAAVLVWRRSRVTSVATALTLVAALVAAVLFSGADGPVARGVWFVAPLEWLALAAAAHAALRADAKRALRIAVPVAVALVGVASLAVAVPRLRSRTALWTAVVAQDPGHETAVLALLASPALARTDAPAAALLAGCVAANPKACGCTTRAVERELRARRLQPAARLLERGAASCADAPGFQGLQADVWFRVGRTVDAQRLADAALDRDPRDAHALFASAAALYAAGNSELAVRFAARAEAAGCGDDATLLVGVLDLQSGDLERAAQAFERVRANQPTNPAPVYNLALIADRAHRYQDAREGYLAALRLDPNLADARYNLAVLTARAGVAGEARHNLEELQRIAPTDPRIPSLRQALGPP